MAGRKRKRGLWGLVDEVARALLGSQSGRRPGKKRKAARAPAGLRRLITREARKRGLKGEPPAYVLRYASELYREGSDPRKAAREAVDYWEETEAYRSSA